MVYFPLLFVPYWIFVGMSPLLYMKDLHVSLTDFGYYQGSLAFVFALGSVLFGLMINRCDQKKMLWLSNIILIFSCITVLFAAGGNSIDPLLITLAFLPFVIGQIVPSNVLFPLYLDLIPEAKGRLTALVQSAKLIFASLGLQTAGYFYDGSFFNIGMILGSFILMGSVVMVFVMRRWRELMKPITRQHPR